MKESEAELSIKSYILNGTIYINFVAAQTMKLKVSFPLIYVNTG